jgi:hypothetical protein
VTKFLKEFDEGKHPLSQKDLDALGTAGFRQYLKASIELTRLRTELERMTAEKEHYRKSNATMSDKVLKLRAENAELRRVAAAIQELRSIGNLEEWIAKWTKAIELADAAMQTEKEPNK